MIDLERSIEYLSCMRNPPFPVNSDLTPVMNKARKEVGKAQLRADSATHYGKGSSQEVLGVSKEGLSVSWKGNLRLQALTYHAQLNVCLNSKL